MTGISNLALLVSQRQPSAKSYGLATTDSSQSAHHNRKLHRRRRDVDVEVEVGVGVDFDLDVDVDVDVDVELLF